MKRTQLYLSSLLAIFILSFSRLYAQPGTLDPTFGSGGIVITDITNQNDRGFSVIQQADGKLLVAGFSNNGTNNDFAVTRYNIDGSLDNTWGTTGIVTTPIGSSDDHGQCVIVQPDTKVIVAGFSNNGTNMDFAVARYLPDGNLDTSFNSTGTVTTPIGAGNDQGHSVVLQTDGKIVVAGFSNDGTSHNFAVVRYNTNGTLDNTFNGTGIVTTDFVNAEDVARSVALQADGKIVVAGWSNNGVDFDFALARYNTNGTLDNTFDTDGKVAINQGVSEQGYSVAIQPDGKIVLAGVASNPGSIDFKVDRYDTTGTLDNSFDTDGWLTTDFLAGNDFGYSLAIQADGKLLVAGQCVNGIDTDFGLARYNTDGSLDLSFDTDGLVTTNLGGTGDVGWSVTIQMDEKVVVAGSNQPSSSAFGTVRYNVCEIIDTTLNFIDYAAISNETGNYNFQWLYCDTVFTPISGETGNSYTPQHGGIYALAIYIDHCADTSACVYMLGAGIDENNFSGMVNVYPNPGDGPLFVSTALPLENADVNIYTVSGKRVYSQRALNGTNTVLELGSIAKGVYILEIKQDGYIARKKIIRR